MGKSTSPDRTVLLPSVVSRHGSLFLEFAHASPAGFFFSPPASTVWPGSSTHHRGGAGRCVPDPHRQDRSKDYASSPSSAAQVGGSPLLTLYPL